MREFYSNLDLVKLNLFSKDENTLKYEEVPDFMTETYKDMLKYLGINVDNVIPEISIKRGGRTESLFFEKKGNSVGKILINHGPVDNFKLSKVISGKYREFTEICLQENQGIYLDDVDVDIILAGNPKRHIIQPEVKVNNKGQKYIFHHKMFKIRPSYHVSTVMVIDLFVNMDSNLVKNFQMETQENVETIEGISSLPVLSDEPTFDINKPIVRI